MTEQLTIWHNPRCSKSRKTLEMLEERGFKPAIRSYLDDPPSPHEMEAVLEALDVQPREVIRSKEDAFDEQGLDDPDLSREDLIAAMSERPILIQRPIVLTSDGRAALGRPPESVLELVDVI
jgi:arsenate reductase